MNLVLTKKIQIHSSFFRIFLIFFQNTYQNSGVCVDIYDATGQDKNIYHGQIYYNWVDATRGVVQDKYGFISVDRISQSSDTQTSEYLKKLARDPIFTVVIY
jgi:hypothetical protein